MNVEIETEAAQFPEKEYINGIFRSSALIRQLLKIALFFFCFYLWYLVLRLLQVPRDIILDPLTIGILKFVSLPLYFYPLTDGGGGGGG